MSFEIGEKVIHLSYGLGEIVGIEERNVQGAPTRCYVVRTDDLTIWIPVDDIQQRSLRRPTPPEKFKELFAILSSQPEPLPEDRLARKELLQSMLKDGQLESICRLVRDLNNFKHVSKLNEQEKSILERALKSLLTEWIYASGISRSAAEKSMSDLLAG